MQMRALGATGERLSTLGFGCMGLVGWYGKRDDDESRATLLAAVDAGITHFDTAAAYQVGENERFVGGVLRGVRERVFLATKCGISRGPDGSLTVDNRPASVTASCDASLKRLGVERIDLFYLHRIDTTVPIEESVGALSRLVTAGKIRYAGLSECSVQTLRKACAVHPIAAVQSEYSLWTRDPERGILAACRELGVTLVAYSPLGRGFLAGNFRSLADLPPDDARRSMPRFQDANAPHNVAIADAVRELAKRRGSTPAQLAIAWVHAQDDNIVTIPGMKTRAHLTDNLAALDLKLTRAEIDELRAIVDRTPVKGERYPPVMQNAVDR